MSRRNIRETVFKLVYETIVCGEVNELSVSLASKEIEGDKSYFDKVFYGIVDKTDKLKGIIKQFARDFEFERLYKVDLSILMVAIYELLYCDDIPFKVSVNEAVELAKLYSTEKSAAYINGILASVIRNKEAITGDGGLE